MINAVFWDMPPRWSLKSLRFRRTYRLHHEGDTNQRARKNVSSNLLVTANVLPSSLIPFILMKVAIGSCEMSVPTTT
jgi:hypothetical protein